MKDLVWLIYLEVSYQEGLAKGRWWSRYLHYTLLTQPIRKEPALAVTVVCS